MFGGAPKVDKTLELAPRLLVPAWRASSQSLSPLRHFKMVIFFIRSSQVVPCSFRRVRSSLFALVSS